MKYKSVLFDLDGTLIDSMKLWRQVDAEFLGSRGIVVPDDLFDHLPNGNSFIQTARYFKDRFGLKDSVQSIMEEWTRMVTYHYNNDVRLKPGAAELLKILSQKGIVIGLGTSNSLPLATAVLTQNGVWHYFEVAVTGEQVSMGKPFPDIYLECAKRLQIDPADCIVVEDTLSGIRAAKAAGMRAIAIFDEDSLAQKEQIMKEADFYCEDYSQIGALL